MTLAPYRVLLNVVTACLFACVVAFAVVTTEDAPAASERAIVRPQGPLTSGNPSAGVARSETADRYPSLAICEVFGDRHCGPALRVAWCESRFDVNARNGQYRGLFQMGLWERRRYGHGRTVLAQTRAAYRYFVATGRTWRPWECRP